MTKNKFSGPFLPFPRWVLNYLGEDSISKVVLLTILLYMDSDTQQVTTSYNHVAKLTGYSRSTIIRSVNRLVSSGVLMRQVRFTNGRQISNRYVVNFNNPNVFETSQVASGGVAALTLVGSRPDTPRGSSRDTGGSVTPDTQSRITNNKNNLNKNHPNKKEKKIMNEIVTGYEIDPNLLKGHK